MDSKLIDINQAYENAVKLSSAKTAYVTFEYDGMIYTVKPHRLARKIREIDDYIAKLKSHPTNIITPEVIKKCAIVLCQKDGVVPEESCEPGHFAWYDYVGTAKAVLLAAGWKEGV